jgi:hypothetical protein
MELRITGRNNYGLGVQGRCDSREIPTCYVVCDLDDAYRTSLLVA